jgi:hypothetical protein
MLIVSTWATYGPHLTARGDSGKLLLMAQQIFDNTRTPLIESDDTESPTGWFGAFSGPNLRWEALAIIFVHIGLGEVACAPPGKDKRSVLMSYRECCASCISLANPDRTVNSLMLYALYKRSVLDSILHGDASEYRLSK